MNQDRWEKSQWKKDTKMKENVRDESEKERQDRPCRGELETDTGLGVGLRGERGIQGKKHTMQTTGILQLSGLPLGLPSEKQEAVLPGCLCDPPQ